jgi:hypothetical protein
VVLERLCEAEKLLRLTLALVFAPACDLPRPELSYDVARKRAVMVDSLEESVHRSVRLLLPFKDPIQRAIAELGAQSQDVLGIVAHRVEFPEPAIGAGRFEECNTMAYPSAEHPGALAHDSIFFYDVDYFGFDIAMKGHDFELLEGWDGKPAWLPVLVEQPQRRRPWPAAGTWHSPARGTPFGGRRAECLAAAAEGLAGKDAFPAPTLTRQDMDAVPSP